MPKSLSIGPGGEALDIAYAFKLPPRRAIAYFKQKGYAINWNWWETWQSAHARAFTVAKATRIDILSDIRAEVLDALQNGTTPQQFAKNLEPKLVKHGWWGKQTIVDSIGNAEIVQLGSPRRLATIYRANMRTAREVAHYQTRMATVKERPYWMYDAIDDLVVRPAHFALDGLVFHYTDPFWLTHSTPNGFNCRCRIRTLSAEDVKRRGLKISKGADHLHTVEQKVGVDKRTGEIIYKPATMYKNGNISMTPDPGWNYSVGAAGGNIPPLSMPPLSAAAPIAGEKAWQALGLPAAVTKTARSTIPFPRVKSIPAAADFIHQTIIAGGGKVRSFSQGSAAPRALTSEIRTASGVDNVILSEAALLNIAASQPRRSEFTRHVLPALRDPAEVWLVPVVQANGNEVYEKVFISGFTNSGKIIAVRESPKLAWLSWTFYLANRDSKINEIRQGHLLYKRPGT